MNGKLTKSHIGAWTFDAEDGSLVELTLIAEGDESGVYRVRDESGREWTLVDTEDRAELLPG